MAKINICDLCKQPGETNHRLNLFLKDGKKKLEKKEAEICAKCRSRLESAIDSNSPLSLSSVDVTKQNVPVAYIAQPNTLTPEEVGNGAFKVPSQMTYAIARKLNKETAKAEAGDCKHEEKSMEDNGVVCRKCKRPVED